MVFSLYQVLGIYSHIVSQVIKAELIVGPESDVGVVCLAAGGGIRLVLVDAIYGKSMKLIYWSHPLGVAF